MVLSVPLPLQKPFHCLCLAGLSLLPKAGELWFGVVTRCVYPGNGEVRALPIPPE